MENLKNILELLLTNPEVNEEAIDLQDSKEVVEVTNFDLAY